MSFLVGEKVILRPVTRADLSGPYAGWINSQDSDMFTEHAQFPHSLEELERYFEEKNSSQDIWLAITEKSSGKHVGNILLSGMNWIHRKGYYSIIVGDKDSQGKGYGYEASILLCRHAFGKLNLNRIELGVHEDNTGARKVYAKLGFVEEGRLRQALLRNGTYKDVIIMGLLADDFYKVLQPQSPE